MNIQKKDHKKGREKGFTLIEVLVAIAILSFGILAIASMQSSALLGTGKSNSVSQANAIAMDRMERIMAMPYSSLAVGSGNDMDSDFFSGICGANQPHPPPLFSRMLDPIASCTTCDPVGEVSRRHIIW